MKCKNCKKEIKKDSNWSYKQYKARKFCCDDCKKEYLRKKRNEYMRKYNETEKGKLYNRFHAHKWRKENKKKHDNRKKQSSTIYRDIIINFLEKRDGNICGICGMEINLEKENFHIDHINPIQLGGEDTLENVRLAHQKCNLKNSVKIRAEIYGY